MKNKKDVTSKQMFEAMEKESNRQNGYLKKSDGRQLDAQITTDMYYNANQLFSFNPIIAMALGERGNGKTTQGLMRAISDFKKGFCTMYVRRTRKEIDNVKDKICNGVAELPQYQNMEFSFNGDWWYIDDKPFIYCLPLSESSQFKSAQFPNFNFIIFDEYIMTKTGYNHYLKNEMTLLLDLLSTVFRERKKNLYIASNSVSYANPLFEFFDIRPKPNQRFIKQYVEQPWGRDYTIVVELTDTKEYQNAIKNSTYAKMLEGTSYYNYAIGNQSLEDNDDFIVGSKPPRYDWCLFNIKIEGQIYGIWRNSYDTEHYYVGRQWDNTKEFNFNYAIYKSDIDKRFQDIKFYNSTPRLKYFARAYFKNNVLYENITIKNRIYTQFIAFLKY